MTGEESGKHLPGNWVGGIAEGHGRRRSVAGRTGRGKNYGDEIMMTGEELGKQPAFPTKPAIYHQDRVTGGLTKLEYIAANQLAACTAPDPDDRVSWAIAHAMALLDALAERMNSRKDG